MKYFNMEKFPKNELIDLSIVSNDKVYDLHNDADFLGLRYNVSEKKILLIWRYPSNWFMENGINIYEHDYIEKHNILKVEREIKLIFDLVSYLQIIPRDSEIPFSEDNCLANIIIENGDKFNDEKFIFEFQSGLEIGIKAKSITFIDT